MPIGFNPVNETSQRSKLWSTCYWWTKPGGGCTKTGNGEDQWHLPSQDEVSGGELHLVAKPEVTDGLNAKDKLEKYYCVTVKGLDMPTVTWNKEKWDKDYDWPQDGDEWSRAWGGPQSQWITCVWPRVAAFLPASSVLEIAPGYGRWTEYLLPQATSYLGVDLSESCVRACTKRFAGQPHATFAVNDGATLPMVADQSVDFIFSFDSLVHVDDDALGAYLQEFSRVLSPDGVAFIHHSNAGIYRRTARWRHALAKAADLIPDPKEALACSGITAWHKSRSLSVTAQSFASMAGEAGLACTGQEAIGWASPLLIDCISIVTRRGSRWDRTPTFSRNRYFWLAAFSARAAAHALEL